MLTFASFLLAALLSVAPAHAAHEETSSIPSKGALESELKLAREPGVYLVFDLDNGQVLVKARGMILRSLSVTRNRVWGNVQASPVRFLASKSALLKPEREKIKPGRTGTETSSSPLELQDMPSRYLLHLSENLTVRIDSEPADITAHILGGANSALWSVLRSGLAFGRTLQGRQFQWIELSMPEPDARTLYWAFAEGGQSVIRTR